MALNTHPAAPFQSNPLDLDGGTASGETVPLREIVEITRVRLLTEDRPGYGRIADISYIWGKTADGRHVHVAGHPGQAMLRDMKKRFIEWAKEEGVYGVGIGLLDEGRWSVMH